MISSNCEFLDKLRIFCPSMTYFRKGMQVMLLDSHRREFCEREDQCIEKCRKANDCPRGMNCIDGGCRNYRCFNRQDCTGRRSICNRYGRCQNRRRPRRPWRRPGGGFTVVSTHSQNHFLGSISKFWTLKLVSFKQDLDCLPGQAGPPGGLEAAERPLAATIEFLRRF